MNNMGHSLGFCLVNSMCKPARKRFDGQGAPLGLEAWHGPCVWRSIQQCYPRPPAIGLWSARACGVHNHMAPLGPNHWLIIAYCASLPQTRSGCSHGSVWARPGPSTWHANMYMLTSTTHTHIEHNSLEGACQLNGWPMCSSRSGERSGGKVIQIDQCNNCYPYHQSPNLPLLFSTHPGTMGGRGENSRTASDARTAC